MKWRAGNIEMLRKAMIVTALIALAACSKTVAAPEPQPEPAPPPPVALHEEPAPVISHHPMIEHRSHHKPAAHNHAPAKVEVPPPPPHKRTVHEKIHDWWGKHRPGHDKQ